MGKIDESWLWNKRMVHMNFNNLVKISTKQVVRDMPKNTKTTSTIFKQCQHGKKSRVNFKTKEYATSKPLELVHADLCGSSRTKTLQGNCYIMLLVDDYKRMTWVSFLKNKFRALEKFKGFKGLVEDEIDIKIKFLISDNGGEFTSNEFE
jgi:hypothetical protein